MKDRTTAIILCFFLGGFGLHKFYLGQTGAGIVYLLFCWTMIPGVIAFFEFLGFCFMSDRQFAATYNYQYLDNSAPRPAIDSSSPQDITTALYDLKKLYEDGVITADEYEEKRRKMLDRM
jgi:TM2 domain-containing membrane protein YozV